MWILVVSILKEDDLVIFNAGCTEVIVMSVSCDGSKLLKELDFKGKEPVFDSNSFLSLVTLRSIEQAAADDDEEANKCEHFTIR